MFHIQATTAYLVIIFRIEAIAYKPILQAALEYKPRGSLLGTYGIRSKPMDTRSKDIIILIGETPGGTLGNVEPGEQANIGRIIKYLSGTILIATLGPCLTSSPNN